MDIYMPGYIQNTMMKFEHPRPPDPQNPQYVPFKEDLKQYRVKVQFAKETGGTPAL